MRSKLKKTAKLALRIGVSIGLLTWLFIDTDPKILLEALLDISPLTWAVAFLMYIISQLVSSLRWFCLARGLEFPGKLSTYIGYYFVGMYFNLFLPTSVGGDVLKVMFLSRGEAKKLKASFSVIMDRLLGLTAMFCLGAGASIIYKGIIPANFSSLLCISFVMLLIAPVILIRVHHIISKTWPEFAQRLSPLKQLWQKPKTITAGFLLSLILQALGMGAVALLANDMTLSPHPAFYFAAFPLVAVITLLPLSFNGIGIREGGFVYFMGIKGVPPEKALTLSLSFFAIQVTASLIGGLAYIVGFHKKDVTN